MSSFDAMGIVSYIRVGSKWTCPDISLTNDNSSCLGYSWKSGSCILPESGVFKYQEELLPISDLTNLCTNSSTLKSKMSKIQADGKLQGPGCSWVADLDPKTLVSHFGGKVFLFFGASHIRNIFSGVVNSIRRTGAYVERHESGKFKEKTCARLYQVWVDRDKLTMYSPYEDDLVNAPFLKRPKRDSVVFVYIWSHRFSSQMAYIRVAFPILKPDIVINSIIAAHEPNIQNFFAWQEAWQEYTNGGSSFSYMWFNWTWGHKAAAEHHDNIIGFLKGLEQSDVSTFYMNYDWIHDSLLIGHKLMLKTFHSACVAKPNYDSNRIFIESFGSVDQSCVDPYDRAYARIVTTFALSQKSRTKDAGGLVRP